MLLPHKFFLGSSFLGSLVTAFLLAHPSTLLAQRAPEPTAAPATSQVQTNEPAESNAPTMFRHPADARYSITGQANIIFQGKPGMHSPYAGPNSFLGRAEYKTSLIGTLFLGVEALKNPRHSADFFVNVEAAGGRGDSEALGLAGFTNLDVVRNPSLGSKPYIARYEYHQVIGLSKNMIRGSRTTFSLADELPERRIDIHIGKMTLPDFLDINSIGTDSHLQFLNWTVDNNGAWDYAADTRGYTKAAIFEYDDRLFSARYALAMMPVIANGIDIDTSLRRASGQNVEVELRRGPLSFLKRYAPLRRDSEDIPTDLASPNAGDGRHGVVRVLGYVNHAHMGLYRDAIKRFQAGVGTAPDVVSVEKDSEIKYGFGVNVEQEVTASLRIFGRFGWNEGQHESFAYTEVDQTIEAGGDLNGSRWHRPNDKIGLVGVSNAIKKDHQDYLRLGGLGFLLGDGKLNYAREDIFEAYYNVHAYRGIYYALDTQFIAHPGYNQDRGPAVVSAVRMHVDF